MSESTLETPCLIILCDEIPQNVSQIFSNARIQTHEQEGHMFHQQVELNRLNMLLQRYEGRQRKFGMLIHDYQDSQLLMAKMNLNLGHIFRFQAHEDLDRLDRLFDITHVDQNCIEKIDECIGDVIEMQKVFREAGGDEVEGASQRLLELLNEARPLFDVYFGPGVKLLNQLKV